MKNHSTESQPGQAVSIYSQQRTAALPGYVAEQLNQPESPEMAIRKLFDETKHLIDVNGLPTTINGEAAVVTQFCYPETVQGKTVYARAFKRKDMIGDDVFGLLFDKTVALTVDTTDPDLIHFEQSIDGNVGLATSLQAGHKFNDASTIEYVDMVVKRLQLEVTQQVESKAWAMRLKRERRLQTVKNSARYVAAAVLCGGLVSGVASGIRAADQHGAFDGYDVKYDAKGYTLPVTQSVERNQTMTPVFLPELTTIVEHSTADAPDLNDTDSGKATTVDDGSFKVGDGIRRVVLTSSKKDKNCVSIKIDGAIPNDQRLAAWTGSVDAEGNSRAGEFTVRLNPSHVAVCWIGQELNKSDDPAVLLQLVTNK